MCIPTCSSLFFVVSAVFYIYQAHEGVLWLCRGVGCFGGSQLIWVLNHEPILVSWFSILESGEHLTVVLVHLQAQGMDHKIQYITATLSHATWISTTSQMYQGA